MRIFNSDGSEAEMCGNGIRCVGKYVYDHHLTDKQIVTIETLAGIKKLKLFCDNGKCQMVQVDMGEPKFISEDLPNVEGEKINRNFDVTIGDKLFRFTVLSMGNPHAITFVEDVNKIPIETYGPIIENHSAFPNKTNVEFVQIKDRDHIKMRVWERGVGETMACGTGACASAIASGVNGYTNENVTVELPGGNLNIQWGSNNHVYMEGPAVEVFDGQIN